MKDLIEPITYQPNLRRNLMHGSQNITFPVNSIPHHENRSTHKLRNSPEYQMTTAIVKIMIDNLTTEINFAEKTSLENFLESYLTENDQIPQIKEYYVTIIDQHIERGPLENSEVNSSSLVISLIIYAEYGFQGLKINLSDELFKLFEERGNDLSIKISESQHDDIFRHVISISPLNMIEKSSFQSSWKFRRNVFDDAKHSITVGLSFLLIGAVFVCLLMRRRHFTSRLIENRLYPSKLDSSLHQSNENEMVSVDQIENIFAHNKESQNPDTSNSFPRKGEKTRKQSLFRKDPRQKHLNSQRLQKTKKVNHLLKKTNSAFSVSRKLSTIYEGTWSLSSSHHHGNPSERTNTLKNKSNNNQNLVQGLKDMKAGNDDQVEATALLTEVDNTLLVDAGSQGNDQINASGGKQHDFSDTQNNGQNQCNKSLLSVSESSAFEPYHPSELASNHHLSAVALEPEVSWEENHQMVHNERESGCWSKTPRPDSLTPNIPPALKRLSNPSIFFEDDFASFSVGIASEESSPDQTENVLSQHATDSEKKSIAQESVSNAFRPIYPTSTDQPEQDNQDENADTEALHVSDRTLLKYRGISIQSERNQTIPDVKEIFVASMTMDDLSLSTISADSFRRNQNHNESNIKQNHDTHEKKENINDISAWTPTSKHRTIKNVGTSSTGSPSTSSHSTSSESGWIDESNIHSLNINSMCTSHMAFSENVNTQKEPGTNKRNINT